MRNLINRLLSRVTKDPREQKNIKHLGLAMLIQSADLPLYTGTELQAFQVGAGLRTGQMGGISMAGNITTALIMLLSASFIDKVKNRVNSTAWTYTGMALFPLTVLIISLGPESFRRPQTVYPIMTFFSVVAGIFIALINLLWATVFSRSIRNEIRGRFFGIVGMVGGVIGILLGLLSAMFLKRYGFPNGFILAFALGTALSILAGIAIRGTKELPDLKGKELPDQLSPFENMKQVLKLRQFRLLMPANVLRGLGDGAGVFAMAVGMKRLGLSCEYAGYTTSLTYLAGLTATLLIGFTVDRFGAGRVIPRVNILLAAGLMGMVLVSKPMLFLACFLLWQMMLTMEGIAIPLLHFEIVPVELIGAFSGIRLMTFMATTGISSWAVGHLLEHVSSLYVYAFCAGIKLTEGMLFWYGAKVIKNEQRGPVWKIFFS